MICMALQALAITVVGRFRRRCMTCISLRWSLCLKAQMLACLITSYDQSCISVGQGHKAATTQHRVIGMFATPTSGGGNGGQGGCEGGGGEGRVGDAEPFLQLEVQAVRATVREDHQRQALRRESHCHNCTSTPQRLMNRTRSTQNSLPASLSSCN